jgi:hypothetical protein
MEIQATREKAPQGRAEKPQEQGHAESGHPNAILIVGKCSVTPLPQVPRPGVENSKASEGASHLK